MACAPLLPVSYLMCRSRLDHANEDTYASLLVHMYPRLLYALAT
jgi:hypothetical protein